MSVVKSVSLVGLSMPNSNKHNGQPVTLNDLKIIKKKVIKEVKEKVVVLQPVFDMKWNANKSLIELKKSYLEANESSEYGYTFMFTENKELLLIHSSSKNAIPALRPKFLKGAKATPKFKSEFGEFFIRMYLDTLNETVLDGNYYLLSENRHFNLVPVNSGVDDVTAYQVVDSIYAENNPEPVIEETIIEEDALVVEDTLDALSIGEDADLEYSAVLAEEVV